MSFGAEPGRAKEAVHRRNNAPVFDQQLHKQLTETGGSATVSNVDIKHNNEKKGKCTDKHESFVVNNDKNLLISK